MAERPNFVVYMTDQHRADCLGCYGHPVLQTPNIDGLAKVGMTFDNFYVSSPVCMPNRASLMTCRMPTNHGVRMNGIPLSRQNVTFVELLRDAGYKTALIGKSHLLPNAKVPPPLRRPAPRDGYHAAAKDLRDAWRSGFDDPWYESENGLRWADPDHGMPTPFYGFDHVELAGGNSARSGYDFNTWLRERLPNGEAHFDPGSQLDHDYSCPQALRMSLPEKFHSTTYIAERAEAWIAEQAGNDQPFFLMVSWPDPHHPFNPPGKYWDMYSPDDMPVPEAFSRDDWIPPPHVQGVLDARYAGTANLNGMNTIGCYSREAQEAQALTCGMVAMIDDAVGRVERGLDVAGVVDRTSRIFTSDHGEHLGDHRLLLKGAEQYEQITRVPFVWAGPSVKEPSRTDKIGQTHDIGTTILEQARIEPSYGMQGIDLLGDADRDAAYIQYAHQRPMDGLGTRPHVHTIRTHRHRLSVFEGLDWGECYDLVEDPGEFENLWADPDAQTVKATLFEQLLQAELSHVGRTPMPTRLA